MLPLSFLCSILLLLCAAGTVLGLVPLLCIHSILQRCVHFSTMHVGRCGLAGLVAALVAPAMALTPPQYPSLSYKVLVIIKVRPSWVLQTNLPLIRQKYTNTANAYYPTLNDTLMNEIADTFSNAWPIYVYNLTQGVVRYDTHVREHHRQAKAISSHALRWFTRRIP